MSNLNRIYYHVEGVKQGIIKAVSTITSQKYSGDRSSNLDWQNLSYGLTGIVSVMLPQPEHGGAAMWELISPEVTNVVSSLVQSAVFEHLQKNPLVLEKVLVA